MRRPKFCTMISLLLCVMLASSLGLGQETSSASTPVQKSSGPTLGPSRSDIAPDFTLESVNGETVRLSDFRGRTVLLYFWATWCGPCKIITPWFVGLQNKYGTQGFQVIGVAVDEDATRAEIGEFADKLRVNYPVLVGNEKVAEAYGGLPALPVTFFISPDGKVVERVIGVSGRTEFEHSVRQALNTKAGPVESSDASPASQPQK
jgi:peroxiredoxin